MRNRSLPLFAALILGAASASAQFTTTNLLANPGAETGALNGWIVGGDSSPFVGTHFGNDGILPHSGSYCFIGGTGTHGALTQMVTLVGGQGITAAAIDAGGMVARISFWEQGLDQGVASDDAGIALSYFGAFTNELGTDTTPVIDAHFGSWKNYFAQFPIPPGTRYLRYTMNFNLNVGADIDAFIDDNRLIVASTNAPVTALGFFHAPRSQVSYVNDSVTFTSSVLGGRPLSYRWYRGGTLIPGADTNDLTLMGLTTAEAGDYRLVVSNAYGDQVTATAHLTVYSGAITNGLVAHLKFDGNDTDSSGNGNNGSAVGTPTFEPGIIGQAVHVISSGTPAGNPATNNYVTLGNPPQLDFGTNDFSISFWAKISHQSIDEPFISNKNWDSGYNPGWALATAGNGMKWNLQDDQSGRRDSRIVAPQLEDGHWHNVVVTFIRSGFGTIYVDGQAVNTAIVAPDRGKPIGSVNTPLPINIGQDGTGLYTDGPYGAAVDMLVDDLGIWNRALAPSEVASIYAQGEKGRDLTAASGVVAGALLKIGVSSGTVDFSWAGASGVWLQRTFSLNPPLWTNIPGTDGASTYSQPETNSGAFYRLYKP